MLDSKEFNTIKSFGDGQNTFNKNMNDDIYNVLLNGECLSYNKKNDVLHYYLVIHQKINNLNLII